MGEGHAYRDLVAAPYDRQEQRAANYLYEIAFGGGDDPVGNLICAHRWMAQELRVAKTELERIRKMVGAA